MAAVLRLENPVPGVRPYQQAAPHLHAPQGAPILERVVEGDAEIAFADAQQHRRFPVCSVRDRTLVSPHGIAFPWRTAISEFAAINRIACAPLTGQIHFAGVTD